MLRADNPSADSTLIRFAEMAPGFHLTTGPAAIFWNPAQVAGGRFRAELDVFLFDPGGRREAFGLFIGGRDLTGQGQSYTYFLIREGGEFLVKSREGRETATLVEWTPHPAINSWATRSEGEATAHNVLVVEAGDAEIRFLINGQELTRISRNRGSFDGIVGIRVNHQLNLHVSGLTVSPLGLQFN